LEIVQLLFLLLEVPDLTVAEMEGMLAVLHLLVEAGQMVLVEAVLDTVDLDIHLEVEAVKEHPDNPEKHSPAQFLCHQAFTPSLFPKAQEPHRSSLAGKNYAS
jgi:hypothetical protein